MAKKKKEEKPQGIKNVEQTLTKTEQFLGNYKMMLTVLGVIVALVAIVWLARLYLSKRSEEAGLKSTGLRDISKWTNKPCIMATVTYLGF